MLQGTLDLMVLKTLESMGPLHGYGIARRIEQISDAVLKLNEGTVYASLMRLRHRRWISASWGTSENNRKAKFYAITRTGRQQLAMETENWERIAGVIGRSCVPRSSPDMWSRLLLLGSRLRSTLARRRLVEEAAREVEAHARAADRSVHPLRDGAGRGAAGGQATSWQSDPGARGDLSDEHHRMA